MAQIPIKNKRQKNLFALVSDEDADWAAKYTWYDHKGYVTRKYGKTTKRMHREIMNAPLDMVIDHINGDKRDNRRENLRICSMAENQRNYKKRSDGKTSKYKGVSLDSPGVWRASIRFNYRLKNLGRYKTEVEAAEAYNRASDEFHGIYGKKNIICA